MKCFTGGRVCFVNNSKAGCSVNVQLVLVKQLNASPGKIVAQKSDELAAVAERGRVTVPLCQRGQRHTAILPYTTEWADVRF